MKVKKAKRWAMVIDQQKCFGCGACVVACAQANKATPNHWRRVFDCGVSDPPERRRLVLPLNCMHCSNPPCEQVCPTTATFKRPDGIVDIDYQKCIGCGYCIVACPYYARVILFTNEYDLETRIMAPGDAPAPDYLSVASKCCFCRPRIERGIEKGLTPGVDEDATPACVVHCSAKAISFGDLNDPASDVARIKREQSTICLQESLGTRPCVFYTGDSQLMDASKVPNGD
jgi:phenylacetyl-CoA:acceptor oxidoreductase 27-kDa subunit